MTMVQRWVHRWVVVGTRGHMGGGVERGKQTAGRESRWQERRPSGLERRWEQSFRLAGMQWRVPDGGTRRPWQLPVLLEGRALQLPAAPHSSSPNPLAALIIYSVPSQLLYPFISAPLPTALLRYMADSIRNIRNGLLARRAPVQRTPAEQRAADSLVAELAGDAQARALAESVVYTEFGPGLIDFFITDLQPGFWRPGARGDAGAGDLHRGHQRGPRRH